MPRTTLLMKELDIASQAGSAQYNTGTVQVDICLGQPRILSLGKIN